MSCGAETEASALLTSLTADTSFPIPEVDFNDPLLQIPGDINSELYTAVSKLTNADLSSGTVNGTGTFEVLMRGFEAHLDREFKNNRITGAEYSKTYTALTTAAMGTAVQFLLGKDQSFWQAQQAQIAAITARVQLQTAKVQLAALQMEALTQKTNYALAKLRLATESQQYCISKFNLESMLPAQLDMLEEQRAGQTIQNSILQFNVDSTLPAQLVGITNQNAQIEAQTNSTNFSLASILPKQAAQLTAQIDTQIAQTATLEYTIANILPKQALLVQEQAEVQHSQTADIRTDGGVVNGTVLAQKQLYQQQVISYRRDAEVKVAKLFTDAWTVQKTIDEGIVPPDNFTNSSIDAILNDLKTNNGIG